MGEELGVETHLPSSTPRTTQSAGSQAGVGVHCRPLLASMAELALAVRTETLESQMRREKTHLETFSASTWKPQREASQSLRPCSAWVGTQR
jgi:hypothetical protein